MPKSPTDVPKTRKARNSQPRYYKVSGLGNSSDMGPTLVKAKTQADVLNHLLHIELATPEDLIDAGTGGWSVIDLVNPPKPLSYGSQATVGAAQTAANGAVSQP
jgi:hypothetical protein